MLNLESVAQKMSELGKPSKKVLKVGNLSQPVRPLPPLARLGILNCYFFIAYLGFIEHEMDFDINLFFCHPKVFWHSEKFRVQPYISSINPMQNVWKTNISKKKEKNVFVFFTCFRAFWAFFKNLLRGWDPGGPLPPLLGQIPNFHRFFYWRLPLVLEIVSHSNFNDKNFGARFSSSLLHRIATIIVPH